MPPKKRKSTVHRLQQTAVQVEDKVFDVKRLNNAQLVELRYAEQENRITCPSCKQLLQIIVTEQFSAKAKHSKRSFNHEPEDLTWFNAKRLVANQLQSVFPSAEVDCNVELDNHLADVVLVSSTGALLSVELQSNEPSKNRVIELQKEYRNQAIKGLWLLDYRRLNVSQEKQIIKAPIKRLELELLRLGEPLIYLNVDQQKLTRLFIPANLKPLIADQKTTSLGQLPCLIKSYPLSQLRVRQGKWFFEEPSLLRLPRPPALPKRLQTKLDQLD